MKSSTPVVCPLDGDNDLLSTCASSAELDNYIRSSNAVSSKQQQTSEDLGDPNLPAASNPQIIERRTFQQCIDPIGIANAMWNFDYSRVVWTNVLIHAVLHLGAGIGLYRIIKLMVKWQTVAFSLAVHVMAAMGITAGYHRLWSHKTYKAHPLLEMFLLTAATFATQNSCFEWSRDHRSHHKHTETEADPHNAGDGLFFAHMGWLLLKKKDAVKRSECNVSDLEKSKIIMFQHKYYNYLVVMASFIIPTFVPYFFWQESLGNAYSVAFTRVMLTLHATWCVNSLAHWWGDTPYDATIYPVENYFVSFLTVGEGWHNYHHAFPNDYRASDRNDPMWFRALFNPTQILIDSCASVGLVWSRVTVPRKLVQMRISTHGVEALTKMKLQ
eukprot:GHVH01000554.1.p2 GENE.GHVH01000554.1~~GHVH01000554.1.p2  ORF type:complete len:385 (-),score=36.46 GHVH01000554.1:1308-2462(-)